MYKTEEECGWEDAGGEQCLEFNNAKYPDCMVIVTYPYRILGDDECRGAEYNMPKCWSKNSNRLKMNMTL